MKILISAYACDPTIGSESANGWNRVLSNALHGTEVVCLTANNSKKIININEYIKILDLTNVRFVYVKVPDWVEWMYRYQLGVYFHYLVWQHQAYKIAKELLKKESFDLVHHVTLGSIQMGSELWKLNLPFVYGPLGGGQHAPESLKKYFFNGWRSEVMRKWIGMILLLYTKKAITKASFLLATNQETYDLAKKYKPKMLKLLADSTLPDNFFPEQLPEKEFLQKELKIFWIGRIFPRKGLVLVMEALSKVKIPFKLTIVGHGPLSESILKWTHQYGLEGRVNNLGKLPWSQVKDAYQNNDIFMFCSLRDSSAVQYIEAMAWGLPIITLDIHGGKLWVPDGAGIKVKVADPDSTTNRLAEAVEYMYNNPEKRKEYSIFAFNYAKNFKESVNSLRFLEIYEEVLQAHGKKPAQITEAETPTPHSVVG